MKKKVLNKTDADPGIRDLEESKLTPQKLHELMAKYNWDDGIAIPSWVIRNPICDKGTALMIYWMAGAGYYVQFETREEVPEFQKEAFDLITEIEERYTAGLYTHNEIAFDPRSDVEENNYGHDWVNEYSDVKKIRKVPAEMLFANKT